MASADISPELIRLFSASLSPTVPVASEARRVHTRSGDAPSWIHFVQTPEFWIQTLVSSVAWDGVKNLWAKREEIRVSAANARDSAVANFALALADMRSRLDDGTAIFIGCPTPNEFLATLLELRARTPDAMALEVADFLACLPLLDEFYEQNGWNLAGQVSLEVAQNGTLTVRWMDRATLTPQVTVYRP